MEFLTDLKTFFCRQCVVGTTKGYIQLLDLRQPPNCVRTFKSFTGAVTAVACDPASPVIASASLDRYLRIHNLDTKELLYKVPRNFSSNCFFFVKKNDVLGVHEAESNKDLVASECERGA